MITFYSQQVRGKGLGTKIGFPTINIELDNLPEGLDIGLFVCSASKNSFFYYTTGILNLSKTNNGKIRGEYHVMDGSSSGYDYQNDFIQFVIFDKLRDYRKITVENRESTINLDKMLYLDFINSRKTCKNCIFFVAQNFGYSNYTVDGTIYQCLKSRFTDTDNYDASYHGVRCDSHIEGEPWQLDVDGDEPKPTEEWLTSHGIETSILN